MNNKYSPINEKTPAAVSTLNRIRVVGEQKDVIREFTEVLESLNEREFLLLHGDSGRRYAAELEVNLRRRCFQPIRKRSPKGNLDEVEVMSQGLPDVPVIVGIGGGTVIDSAKYLAQLKGSIYISIPTQCSNDGICSPIAVLRDSSGHRTSLAAKMPVAVIVDLEVIQNAPIESLRAGVGELVSNLTALDDWRRAHRLTGEPINDFSALIAEEAALSVFQVNHIQELYLRNEGFVRRLVNGLILSGVAMEIAGNSRPCSGAEHLFSHSLDYIFDLPNYHGEQVGFGALLIAFLQGNDWQRFAKVLQKFGLPICPADLRITDDQVAKALLHAPKTRPERHTILNDIPLDVAAIKAMLSEIKCFVMK